MDGEIATLSQEHQRLGYKGTCSARLPERWQVQILERGVIARAVAIGNGPEDLAFVEVYRREASIRWLERTGQAAMPGHPALRSERISSNQRKVRFGMLRLHELDDVRASDRRYV